MTGIMQALIAASPSTKKSLWVTVTPGLLQTQGSLTGNATASPDAGTAPFTYSWSATDIPGMPVQILSPSSATTQFKALAPLSGSVYLGHFVCTVTDAAGLVGYGLATAYFYGTP